MKVGVIDVGTNTTRLLVAESVALGINQLERRLFFTRLGKGVDAGGSLDAESIKRTLAAIAEFCAVCGEFSTDQIRIACTSAVRDASNRKEFLAAVERMSGVVPEILNGDTEARLSFEGATKGLPEGRYLVCDIGGGSTEFILGEPGGESILRTSLDIGSVRMTERHLRSDPPATEEMLMMESAVDQALEEVDKDMAIPSDSRLVGVAGTVTSLAAVSLGLQAYDPSRTHGLVLGRTSVDTLYRELARMRVEDRQTIPALPAGRADIIVAGASILSRSMARWGFDEVLVSEKDILDGLALEMLEKEN